MRMTSWWMAGLMLLLLTALPAAAWAEGDALPIPKFKEVSVHDPSIIRAEDGTFYIFGSHMAAAKSDDLIQWKMISTDAGRGCTLVENVQEQMKEALQYAQTTTFWAPDVQRLKDGRSRRAAAERRQILPVLLHLPGRQPPVHAGPGGQRQPGGAL